MEHAPAFDTLRFARTLVDAGVERRHAEAHAKAASAAIGAAAMKTASADGLRAVNDRLGRLERRVDGLHRGLWLQAAGIVVAVAALMKLLPSPWSIRIADGCAMRELSSATGLRSRLRNAPAETII